MYEDNILLFRDTEPTPATPTDADPINYQEIGDQVYQNTYNALKDYYEDYPQNNNVNC